MEQIKFTEKRKLKRYSVRLKVYSQDTGMLLGYAKNLHIEGMMLASEKPISEKEVVKIWFGASKKEKEEKRIYITAFVTWHSFTTSNPRLYYCGLQFIEPGKTAQDKITQVIDEGNIIED